jgi:hypothetical protein
MARMIILSGLLVITIIIYLYYCQQMNHQYEINRIKYLEYKYSQKQKEMEQLAIKTEKCPIDGLNDPRSCYFGSKYQCSWNEKIGRCDNRMQ